MFTTKFPAWSNRARLAWASASLASRTPSITTCFTAVRCMFVYLRSTACQRVRISACQLLVFRRSLLHIQGLDVQLLSLQDFEIEAPARPALQGEAFEPGLLPAIAA